MKKLLKKIMQKNPRIYVAAKILFTSPKHGSHYQGMSPHLDFINCDIVKLMQNYIYEYKKNNTSNSMKLLDVGGRFGRSMVRKYVAEKNYFLLDIEPKNETIDNVMVGDICNCKQIDDNYFDIIYSNNVFEHISEPWKACLEIGRILKPGGLCFTSTVFSSRYHPVPVDYWRFTHSGLKNIFEKYAKLRTLECGYQISNRRANFAGGKIAGNLDGVPVDGYGGWLENWIVIHVGKKEL